MKKKQKKIAKKELEKIYNNRFRWIQAGKFLNGRLYNSLDENPRLKLILKLGIFANLGIWLTVYILALKLVY